MELGAGAVVRGGICAVRRQANDSGEVDADCRIEERSLPEIPLDCDG
jgi:hypothetical protein